MRRVVAAVLGAALVVATATPSWADAAQFRRPNAPHNGYGQNHGQVGGPRGAGGPRFNGGQRFGGGTYRRGGYGAAVGAGVAGLAAGALIGGAIASQGRYYGGQGYDQGYGYPAPVYGGDGDDQGYGNAAPVDGGPAYASQGGYQDVAPASEDTEAYCAQRYKSYDPESQTYLGYDGDRHPCP